MRKTTFDYIKAGGDFKITNTLKEYVTITYTYTTQGNITLANITEI